MRRRSILSAIAALAVHFQRMAAHSEACGSSGFPENVLRIAAFQVLRRAAIAAQQVMVVSRLAELVAQVVIFQQHPAHQSGFHQQAETTVYGGAADGGQRRAEFLRGEGAPLRGDCADDQAPGLGVPITQAAQLGHDVVDDRGRARPRVFVLGMFGGGGCDHIDTQSRMLSAQFRRVNIGRSWSHIRIGAVCRWRNRRRLPPVRSFTLLGYGLPRGVRGVLATFSRLLITFPAINTPMVN